MAHEITNVDSFGENRKVERAWHGLGMELPEGATAHESFKQVGLGWSTELWEVSKAKRPDGTEVEVASPDARLHVRLDTNEVLGMVSEGYRPIGNMELAQFADMLAGEDKAVRCETAGSLRRGKRVFALVKLPKDIEVVDGDVLKNYVLVTNGHDGNSAFQVYHTSVRVVCANTLRMSERDAIKGARFAHTGNIAEKIEMARMALGIVVRQTEAFEQAARHLARIQMTEAKIDAYFGAVYEATVGDAEGDKAKAKRDEILAEWKSNLERADNAVPASRGTAWQALQAITFWHDHQRGRFQGVKQGSEGRIHSNLFGASAADKTKAFRFAMNPEFIGA